MGFDCPYIDKFLRKDFDERCKISQHIRTLKPQCFPLIADIRIDDVHAHGMKLTYNKFVLPLDESFIFLKKKFQPSSIFNNSSPGSLSAPILSNSTRSLNIAVNNEPNRKITGPFVVGLNASQAIYMYALNVDTGETRSLMLTNSSILSTFYENYKSKDGFVYLIVTTENTFGKA